MNKSASELLRALALDQKTRTKAARFRELMDDIEAALKAGVSQARVIEGLAESGLVMTPATFKSNLHRARLARQDGEGSRKASPVRVDGTEPGRLRESAVPSEHTALTLDEIMRSKPDLASLARQAARSRA